MRCFRSWIRLYYQRIPNKFVRFVFVGGLNTAFGYGLYCVLVWLGLMYVWATLVAHVLGVMFNFVTTGTLVFDDRDPRNLLKFLMSYVLTYIINIAANKALQVVAGCDEYLAGAGAMMFTALVSFLILKRFVYKGK